MNEAHHSNMKLWQSAGFWLALALALSQGANALRVLLGPIAYAEYMGLPLTAAADTAWVQVYALRALFLGSFAGFLLATARYRVLASMALIAVPMPVGDFWLVWQAGGANATLARHAVIAAALVAAWRTLHRLADRVAVDRARRSSAQRF
jgi:hypothetical protein